MADNTRREQTESAQSASATQTLALTSADSTALVASVRSMGTRGADGSYNFKSENLDLNLDSVGVLSGTYSNGVSTVSISDLLAGRTELLMRMRST